MKHLYYYISPCPSCHGRRTGRYVREGRDASYIEEQSLKHGEIVRFAKKEPVENAFCIDCGYRWGETPKIRFLTLDEIQKEIDERGTAEAYEELTRFNTLLKEAKGTGVARKIWHFFTGR